MGPQRQFATVPRWVGRVRSVAAGSGRMSSTESPPSTGAVVCTAEALLPDLTRARLLPRGAIEVTPYDHF